MYTRKITQAQVDYVLAHINDRPRNNVAQAAGICMSTMYRIVRENGGQLRHDLATKHEGIEDTVRRHYPDMTASEISARFGYSKTRINTWAKRLGVRHSPETEERIRRENAARLAGAKRCIDYRAAHEKWRRKRRLDELRVLSGLPQRTRFRFAALTTQGRQTVWRMVRKRGYFQVDGEPRTLYYDGETMRVHTEARLAMKYGLHFVAAGDNGEQQTETQEQQ